MDIESKLKELGHTLPNAPKPVASYVPAVQTGSLVVVSGQLPLKDGTLLCTGPVPSVVSEEQAKQAAAHCAVNALAVLNDMLDGDWERFVKTVRIGVFVLSDQGFAAQPAVANGASDLLAGVLGTHGQHARAAVGVNALPLNASVEVEAMFEVRV